jgi:uncharacterized protein with HEPN domain
MAGRTLAPVLVDIIEAIDGIQRATAGRTFEAFKEDWLLRHATQRALEIISEASRHIPHDYLAQRPEIPWRQIRSIGNVLRHEYHKVVDEAVWAVVIENLDPLREAILSFQKPSGAEFSGESGGSK